MDENLSQIIRCIRELLNDYHRLYLENIVLQEENEKLQRRLFEYEKVI